MESAKDLLRAILVQRADRFGLTTPAIDALVHQSQLSVWEPGETIFAAGDRTDLVQLLVRGAVRLDGPCRSDEVHTLRIVPAGHVLSWAPIMETDGPCRFSAVAHTPSLVALVSTRVLDGVLSTLPRDRSRRLQGYCGRTVLKLLAEKVHTQSLPLRDRLAHELEALARDFGVPSEDGVVIDIPLIHDDLARLVAATRPNVSRMLKTFREEGWLRVDDGRFWVRD